MNKNITNDEWMRLFNIAVEFRDRQSWKWMYDDMVFCVQNPYTGEMGYCVVMGNAGEFYGFAVYQGTEGLRGLNRMRYGHVDDSDLVTLQKCLMVSFEDRKDIDKRDYSLIKKLGLKFRGPKQWIQFRNYLPGYYPWYIDQKDLAFLTVALEQALIVIERAETDPEKYFYKNYFFSRIPEKVNGEVIWHDEWTIPESLKPQIVDYYEIDPFTLNRLNKQCNRINSTWVIDYFSTIFPVQDRKDERPYYPAVFLCVDRHSQLILHTNMMKHEQIEEVLNRKIIDAMFSINSIPAQIIVVKEGAYNSIRFLTDKINCSLKIVRRVPILDKIKADMFKMMPY